MTTSATGGYLIPATGPTKSAALLQFFQAVLVGLTGLTGSLVRPAYQLLQPTRPDKDDPTVNWIAFRISKSSPDFNASGAVVNDDTGLTTITRHGDLDLFVSCYGPDSIDTAEKIQAGLDLGQNREALQAAGVGVKDYSDITHVPEDINERFYDRADFTITFKRAAEWYYGVLSFLSASYAITADDAHDTPLEASDTPASSTLRYLASASPFIVDDVVYNTAGVAFILNGSTWHQTTIFQPGEAHPAVVLSGVDETMGDINVFLVHDPDPEDPDLYYTLLSNRPWAEVALQTGLDTDPDASGLAAFARDDSNYVFTMPEGWEVAPDTETDTWTRPPVITKEIVNP